MRVVASFRPFVTIVSFFTVPALFGGCSCTADSESTCSTDADCGPGQKCGPGGVCIPEGSGGSGGGGDCASGVECGIPPICCESGEECVGLQCLPACPSPRERCGEDQSQCCEEDEECYANQCLPFCPSPRVRCGEETTQCCDAADICFSDICTTPGSPCMDFTDCDFDEYCEPTLGVCLPIELLPECEYHPPTGVFSPTVEWQFGPTTAPYARDRSTTAFTDVCATGSPIPFTDTDESVVSIDLSGLTIPFFDGDRSQLWVSTNGWLTLQSNYSGGAEPNNTDLPDTTAPNLLIAPYWDDLTNVTGCALADVNSSQVSVQWTGDVAGETITFKAVINANGHAASGDIEFIYENLGSTQDGDGATVGLEDPATDRGIVHSFDRNGGVSTAYSVLFRYVPLRNHVDALTPPAVFDLDFDGRPEVIFSAYDDASTAYSTAANQAPSGYHAGVLTILNGEDGTIQDRYRVDPSSPSSYDGYVSGGAGLSIGDLNGDGDPEIVAIGPWPTASGSLYVKAFSSSGAFLWASDEDVGFSYNSWGGGLHIADLDADGAPEIFFGTKVFDNTGAAIWSTSNEYSSPTTTAADLDKDGDLELISDHSAWQYAGANTTLYWSVSSSHHFPAVADFDLDSYPEVAFVSGGAVEIVNGTDGTNFWGPVSLGTTGGGPLNIGDFDNDGYPEIGTAGGGRYVVLDLQCTGDPLPAGCEAEWIRWTQPSKDTSSAVTGSSLFDFEGDGMAEVVYSDECYTRVYSGDDGTVLYETPVNTRTATEYPLVADVDGDNNAEIIIVANEPLWECNQSPYNTGLIGTPWVEASYPSPYCGSGLCGYRGLFVYGDALDNWVRTRQLWSGHAYHITNITGFGTIPTPEPMNWLSYNNFRMNAQGAGLFNAPDLVVTEFEALGGSCPDKLVLTATITNEGALGVVAGVKVSFFIYDGGSWQCIGTVLTSEDLLPGASTEVTLDYEVPANKLGMTLTFRAVADSDCFGAGDNNECEQGGEDNNEAETTGQCDAPG